MADGGSTIKERMAGLEESSLTDLLTPDRVQKVRSPRWSGGRLLVCPSITRTMRELRILTKETFACLC